MLELAVSRVVPGQKVEVALEWRGSAPDPHFATDTLVLRAIEDRIPSDRWQEMDSTLKGLTLLTEKVIRWDLDLPEGEYRIRVDRGFRTPRGRAHRSNEVQVSVRNRKMRRTRAVAVQEVREAWFASKLGELKLISLDRTAFVGDELDWRKAMQDVGVNERKYRANRSDCDNFAFAFAGLLGLDYGLNCIVVVDHSGGHAYCAAPVDTEDGLEVRAIEPQTGKFVEAGGNDDYAARRGYALLI